MTEGRLCDRTTPAAQRGSPTHTASNIGLESQLGRSPGRMRLPDGSLRFVVTEALLIAWTTRLGGRLVDPIKTTNMQQMRAMTTWVVEKPR